MFTCKTVLYIRVCERRLNYARSVFTRSYYTLLYYGDWLMPVSKESSTTSIFHWTIEIINTRITYYFIRSEGVKIQMYVRILRRYTLDTKMYVPLKQYNMTYRRFIKYIQLVTVSVIVFWLSVKLMYYYWFCWK